MFRTKRIGALLRRASGGISTANPGLTCRILRVTKLFRQSKTEMDEMKTAKLPSVCRVLNNVGNRVPGAACRATSLVALESVFWEIGSNL
jgi:hypothetical protein